MPQYAGSYHVHGMHMAADAGSPVPYQRDRERSARPTAPNTTTRDQIKHSGRYLGLDSRSHWYTSSCLSYNTSRSPDERAKENETIHAFNVCDSPLVLTRPYLHEERRRDESRKREGEGGEKLRTEIAPHLSPIISLTTSYLRYEGIRASMADNGIGLQEIDAGANACSVEWCPVAGLESYVACSTYLLEPAADAVDDAAAEQESAVKGEGEGEEVKAGAGRGQTRSGSIVVHRVGWYFRDPHKPTCLFTGILVAYVYLQGERTLLCTTQQNTFPPQPEASTFETREEDRELHCIQRGCHDMI